ncbi:uncharacterized protein Z520_04118 [Fonsecaea multimorphosa CBS 102226]|uniref:Uncharacterized protein n=1 Tax=Fonsecaea multimorphosa CBS 102226 TaxID=1442371 RepID=A0A0D2K3R2_9EURO|nr:uncharacterized protein Z520_04118 [Fonsecaea multimorphosa CBS 102226]KIY00433.1 hypothetical protein Z520_04118 [Fonsecaea multimorphosa CBS 102226]
MRLVNARTKQVSQPFCSDIPPYAILSHTWRSEEISFQDMRNLEQNPDQHSSRLFSQEGFKKIEGCCERALRDDLGWIWIDSCCIDKNSSSELSEAINSMFKWYRDAKTCYAYLSDVGDGENPRNDGSTFRHSRWFTRGWTLQELLVPPKLIFFSKTWAPIGERKMLSDVIQDITSISQEFQSPGSIFEVSIAQRMSWAARRSTTREEDIAYCLLGLFDVNMPLLYGEGRKAFRRLQEEIIKQSNDESIFAWGLYQIDESNSDAAHTGALALSPSDFLGCGDIVKCKAWKPRHTVSFELTKKGLRMEIPLAYQQLPPGESNIADQEQIVGLLNCRRRDDLSNVIAIPFGRPYNGDSQKYFIRDGDLNLINRHRDLPARFFTDRLFGAAMFHTIYVRVASGLVNGDRRKQHLSTCDGILCLWAMIEMPPDITYQILHAGGSWDVQCQGKDIMIHMQEQNEENCLGAANSIYIHCRYKDSRTHFSGHDFMVKAELSMRSNLFSNLIKSLDELWSGTSRIRKPKVQCQVTSVPWNSDPCPSDIERLHHLPWAQKATLAEQMVAVKVTKRRVMGLEMHVAAFRFGHEASASERLKILGRSVRNKMSTVLHRIIVLILMRRVTLPQGVFLSDNAVIRIVSSLIITAMYFDEFAFLTFNKMQVARMGLWMMSGAIVRFILVMERRQLVSPFFLDAPRPHSIMLTTV